MSGFVETYIKRNNQFIPITDYAGDLPDENYIDGAIYFEIDGQVILDKKHWDMVDQLWVYIILGLVALNRNDVYESYFPDQPLILRFEPISNQYVKVTIGKNAYKLNRKNFITVAKSGAEQFLVFMGKLVPNASETWNRYMRELSVVKPHGKGDITERHEFRP